MSQHTNICVQLISPSVVVYGEVMRSDENSFYVAELSLYTNNYTNTTPNDHYYYTQIIDAHMRANELEMLLLAAAAKSKRQTLKLHGQVVQIMWKTEVNITSVQYGDK